MEEKKWIIAWFGFVLAIALAFIGLGFWGLIKLIQWIP